MRQARAATLVQTYDQLAMQLAPRLSIDGLVGHVALGLVGEGFAQRTGNLLGLLTPSEL